MTHSGVQEILCKAMLWLVVYGQTASVFWMSVEGGYLISRFTIFAMRNSEGPMFVYLLVGWGAPLIPVITWSILHDQQLPESSFCWVPYSNSPHMWILTAAIGAALIVRAHQIPPFTHSPPVQLNMLFLGSIMAILVRKLWAENAAESKKVWYVCMILD